MLVGRNSSGILGSILQWLILALYCITCTLRLSKYQSTCKRIFLLFSSSSSFRPSPGYIDRNSAMRRTQNHTAMGRRKQAMGEGEEGKSEKEKEKEDAILLSLGQVLWPAGRLVESSCRRFLVSASFNVPAVRVSTNPHVMCTCIRVRVCMCVPMDADESGET